jgi:histidinol-phosphate/aromatic aminotransferase/cobyric acid decarboxylase-like protein
MNQALPNHRNKIYGGAWPVPDPDILEYLMTTSITSTHNEFVNDYFQWFANPHNINGIEKFNSLSYCNGTTEAFDKFYHKHMHKKLRFLRGEYFYHQIMAKRFFKESSFIDDPNDISNDDVVVMSVPFSDTGNVPEHYNDIMTQCEKNNIPVLLDMAYISLAVKLDINVDYQCIDTITTSLSKVFPVAHWRIGMRMQKENLDDTLDAYEMNSYLNTHAVNVGHQLIKQYPADYSFNKYRQQQLSFCNMLDIKPSDSFIFGIDQFNKHPEYNRGGPTNRFCFAKHFQ